MGDIVPLTSAKRTIATTRYDNTSLIVPEISSVLSMINTSLSTGTFGTELAKKTEDNGFYIYALNTGTKKGVDYRSLAEMWRISLDTAKNTIH